MGSNGRNLFNDTMTDGVSKLFRESHAEVLQRALCSICTAQQLFILVIMTISQLLLCWTWNDEGLGYRFTIGYSDQ